MLEIIVREIENGKIHTEMGVKWDEQHIKTISASMGLIKPLTKKQITLIYKRIVEGVFYNKPIQLDYCIGLTPGFIAQTISSFLFETFKTNKEVEDEKI
jgi:hypothetical protein